MINNDFILCTCKKKIPVIMFVFKLNTSASLGNRPNTVNIQYTYVDPYTKQAVTKSVNSTDVQYSFPCVIGDTVTFSNLVIGDPTRGGWGTLFKNGIDVSPTRHEYDYVNSFSVTVTGSSPYIEYYFYYGR